MAADDLDFVKNTTTGSTNGAIPTESKDADLAKTVIREVTLTRREVEEINMRLTSVQVELAVSGFALLLLVLVAGELVRRLSK